MLSAVSASIISTTLFKISSRSHQHHLVDNVNDASGSQSRWLSNGPRSALGKFYSQGVLASKSTTPERPEQAPRKALTAANLLAEIISYKTSQHQRSRRHCLRYEPEQYYSDTHRLPQHIEKHCEPVLSNLLTVPSMFTISVKCGSYLKTRQAPELPHDHLPEA